MDRETRHLSFRIGGTARVAGWVRAVQRDEKSPAYEASTFPASGDSSPRSTAPTALPPPRFRRFGMTTWCFGPSGLKLKNRDRLPVLPRERPKGLLSPV